LYTPDLQYHIKKKKATEDFPKLQFLEKAQLPEH